MGDVRALPWVTDCSKDIDSQPNLDLIIELESLLAMAKKGDLVGLAYVMQHKDDAHGWGWISNDTMGLIYAVTLLEYRMKEAEVEKGFNYNLPEPA